LYKTPILYNKMRPFIHFKCLALIVTFCFLNTYHTFSQDGFPYSEGEYIYRYPKYAGVNNNSENLNKSVKQALDHVAQIYDLKNKKELNFKDIKEILVLENKIEFDAKSKKNSLSYSFSRLIDSTMIFYTYQNSWHYVYFPSLANFVFSDINKAQLFADAIYTMQYPLIDKRRDSILNIFIPVADSFRALKQKPTVTEEQRKLFIQADNLNKQNKVFDAIRMYLKAIELEKTSFPSAYANLALLYAKCNFFDYAILYMKKYLLLVPNAEDARAARDRLYVWEGLIGK